MRSTMVAAVLAVLVASSTASAATILYTFEAPQFVAGTTTPLTNIAPNSGDPTLSASFTSSPTAAGFTVISNPVNALMSGQILQDPTSAADTLTVTLNTFVFSLEVDSPSSPRDHSR